MSQRQEKPTPVAWHPLVLILALALLLGACDTTGSTSTSQPTMVPTSSPQSSTSTPSITPSASTVSSKPALPLTTIRMVDTRNGWALTASSILKTSDGGFHWNNVTPANAGLNPTARGQFMNTSQPPVFFGNVVILPVTITGQSGPLLVLYRSNDGGLSWFQTDEANIQAENTYVVDPSHAWATDTQSGKLYSTSDGGNHWFLTSNTAYQLNALSFTDPQNGWGVTRNQLLQTTDGGKTWQQIPYTIQ
jgi:photosystem II stability/assembly factor-like uncharacterized protein